MIDARAIILRKAFAAESVGRGENGGHRGYGGGRGERSGEGGGGIGRGGLKDRREGRRRRGKRASWMEDTLVSFSSHLSTLVQKPPGSESHLLSFITKTRLVVLPYRI